MTNDDFWELIKLADLELINQGDCLDGVAPIVVALSQKLPKDIRAFEEHMSQKLYALDYACLLNELESSSDSFLYQRCYAIVSGAQFYIDTFSEEKRKLGDFDWCQSLILVAQKAWDMGQDSEWNFTASVSYETGSNKEGHIKSAKLIYEDKDFSGIDDDGLMSQCHTIAQAIWLEEYELASAMIDNGADVNIDNPLYAAVAMKNKELVAHLIQKGADVNQAISEGGGAYLTPLAEAVSRNIIAIAKLLLEAGAIPNATRGDEFCPLGTACDRGNMKMATLLLEAGADPNTQMPGGVSHLRQGSPLFSAVDSKKLAMVELVLSYGANPNIWNENGKYTPLVSAYLDGNTEIMQTLINHGADVNIRFGYTQNTILQSALSKGDDKISSERIAIRKRVASFMLANGGTLNDGTVPNLL